jgi:hypothetical protein
MPTPSCNELLIAAHHLVDRLRHPRSRADEVLAVRRRLVAQQGPSDATDEALALALDLRRLREELTTVLAGVEACGTCARGRSLPHGRWSGGQCCGGATEGVFTDDELASLRLSGTTPAQLAPPRSDHAGCAFRGPEGCSLEAADRPNLCVRYVCRELEGELREGGSLTSVKAIARELGQTFDRFSRVRAAHSR